MLTHTAAGESVFGRLYAVASTAPPAIEGTQNIGTEIVDSAWISGDFGNAATGHYIVSLERGFIAANFFCASGASGGGAAGWCDVLVATDFTDRLDFSVPAGDYPLGVIATLTGRIRGTLRPTGSSNLAHAHGSVVVDVATEGRITLLDTIQSDDPPVQIDQPFEYEMELVAPGAGYGNFTVYRALLVSVDIQGYTNAFATDPGDSTGGYIVSFDGLTISDPRVTWISDSGVFTVPEPSWTGGFGAGLPALGLLAARRKRRIRSR